MLQNEYKLNANIIVTKPVTFLAIRSGHNNNDHFVHSQCWQLQLFGYTRFICQATYTEPKSSTKRDKTVTNKNLETPTSC